MSIPFDHNGFEPSHPSPKAPSPTIDISIDYDKLIERSVKVALGEAKLAAVAAIEAVSTMAPGARGWEDKHRGGDLVKDEILSAVKAVFD